MRSSAAKMSERGTSSVSTMANKVVVNVLHQQNRVATMSGGTTLSPSLSVSANHVIHGNSLSSSSSPILSQEGLSTLLQSYIGSQLLLVSKSNQLSDTTAAVTQPLPSTSGSLLQASANNPVITSCVSQPSTSSRKGNFNVKIINPVKKKEFETYCMC